MRYQSPENMEMRGNPVRLSRSEVWKTLLRSFGVGSGLSLALTYLLYVASPGLVIMEICEALAIPSSLAVQYFGVKLHSAFFETVVNSAFYTLLVFSISILYRRIKTRAR
jgi:hypothetical protein